ncbi:MAG: hypothetical protein IIC86_07695, partial [Chloroflexi bacterium]|nr:hypothetical protein [Chloroflexota bacterium]
MADANNQRSGQVFVEFELDEATIAAAGHSQATLSLTFSVISIGGGVAGTPYTDGLDLRYLGKSAGNRTVSQLWNAVGPFQADILSTSGPTGSHTVAITDPLILSDIADAAPQEYVGFAFLNSVGTRPPATPITPVGNSIAETYAFQMSRDLAEYSLNTAVPEPTTLTLLWLYGAVEACAAQV